MLFSTEHFSDESADKKRLAEKITNIRQDFIKTELFELKIPRVIPVEVPAGILKKVHPNFQQEITPDFHELTNYERQLIGE